LPDDTDAVGIVRHQPGLVLAGETAEGGEGGEVAVHREHAVGKDQGMAVPGTSLEQERAQVVEIVVGERHDGRAGQAGACPQAGMRELVDQYEIAAADQRRNDPGVGEIAGTEHAGVGCSFEAREPRLQRLVERMVPGDEARGPGADAILRDGIAGGILERGMGGEPEIVVARERYETPAATLDDDITARGGHQRATQVLSFEAGKLGGGEVVEGGHFLL
jgi:hypothetical protein